MRKDGKKTNVPHAQGYKGGAILHFTDELKY